MALKVNIGTHGILISAIVLVISVLLLIDRLLATGPVQLILEDGRAIPVEGASYFSLNEVLFFIITAWLGGMSFLYIILYPKENGVPEIDIKGIPENKNTALLAANMLEGDERSCLTPASCLCTCILNIRGCNLRRRSCKISSKNEPGGCIAV